jgi:hypothetical protein
MAVKKLNIAEIPKDKLEQLKPLLQAEGVLVPIGKSIYEVYPTPATKLMKALKDGISLIKKAREKKIEYLKSLGVENIDPNSVSLTTEDLIADEELMNGLKAIIWELIDGVDKEDFENITAGQLIYLLQKLVEVNVNTLPPEFRGAVSNIYKNRIQAVQQVGGNQGNLIQPSTSSSSSQLN